MAELYLEIISPLRIIYNGNILSVTIPGTLGSFQVLKNHAPLLSTFDIGLVKIKESESSTKYFSTGGGTVEVLNNKILVLADSLEAVEDIDVDRAKAAKRRAEERLARKSDIDIERARAALARALNRLSLAEKYIRAEI